MQEVTENPLPPGLRSRFHAPRLIGQGMFGRVVRARDRLRDERVAIKLLLGNEKDAHYQDSRLRFIREAELMQRIEHPGVVRVHEHGESDGQPYMVCRFVEGPDLDSYIKKHGPRLDPAIALRLLEQVLEGLAAAHAAGVIHRDLKPANVILDRQGQPILADFGLGRGAGDDTMTATGTTMGSPGYMCPQQMMGQEPVPDWDVYAAGILGVEMMIGKLPLTGPTLIETHHVRKHPPPLGLRESGVDVHSRVEALLQRVLAAEPDPRPRDAGAFLAELRGAASEDLDRTAELGAEELAKLKRYAKIWKVEDAPITGVPAPSPPAKRLPLGPLVGALVLGVVGVVMLGRGSGGAPTPSEVPSTEEPAARQRRWKDSARALRDALEETPDVRMVLGIPGDLDAEEALATWRRGRRRFTRLARKHDLAGLTRELVEAERPPPPALRDLAWVALAERMLARTTHEDSPGPLYPEDARPRLDEALEKGAQVASFPALSGRTEEDWRADRERRKTALQGAGGSWVTVRSYEDSFRHHPEQRAPNPKLRQLNYRGDPFVDPTSKLPGFVVDKFYERRALALAAPTALEGALEDRPGPLVLATSVQNWSESSHLLLEVRGGEVTFAVVVSRPNTEREAIEGYHDGVSIRIEEAMLPPAPRRFRLTARSLQPLGRTQLGLELGEVHQRVAP